MPIKKLLGTYRERRNALRESFSFKVFMAFAVSMLVMLFAFTIFFIYYQNLKVTENLIDEGKMLAGLLAYSSKTGVFAENNDLFKDAVQGIMSQKDVLAVSIYTTENRIIFADQKRKTKNDLKKFVKANKGKNSESGDSPFVAGENEEAIEVFSPVIIDLPVSLEEAFYPDSASSRKKQEVVGYVSVAMDKSVLRRNILTILFRSFIIAAAFLFSGTFIIYISIKKVTRPLSSLTEAVRLFGLGEPVGKVHVESADEVGRLATAFNTMSDNLKKREEEKGLLEEKLRYAQKMEAVGTLARGIAHDFNNILTTAQGSVYILEKKLHENNSLMHYTEQIRNSINKAKNLTESLVIFSRIQSITPAPVEINTLIRRLRPMLMNIVNIVGGKIDVKISLSDEDLMIMADTLQVEQVLMNLCTNARDAMPDGGVLTIETEPVAADAEEGRRETVGHALIAVSDTGVGIDEEVRAKIFEPFFTTKEVGKGTGLGLAIVYGIIEQHHGHIEVSTKRGNGTAFKIFFPLCGKNCGGGDEEKDTGPEEEGSA
jgi:signal transduction histidine kinase